MKKITFRRERNFYGRRQRAFVAGVNSAIADGEADRFSPDARWYCNTCGFVPLADIARESEVATSGVCKCGRRIDEIPF